MSVKKYVFFFSYLQFLLCNKLQNNLTKFAFDKAKIATAKRERCGGILYTN